MNVQLEAFKGETSAWLISYMLVFDSSVLGVKRSTAACRCCIHGAETCLRWRRQLPAGCPDTPLSPERLGRCSSRFPPWSRCHPRTRSSTYPHLPAPPRLLLSPLPSSRLAVSTLPADGAGDPGKPPARRADTPRGWMPSNPPAEPSSRAPEFRGTHGGLPNTKVSETLSVFKKQTNKHTKNNL